MRKIIVTLLAGIMAGLTALLVPAAGAMATPRLAAVGSAAGRVGLNVQTDIDHDVYAGTIDYLLDFNTLQAPGSATITKANVYAEKGYLRTKFDDVQVRIDVAGDGTSCPAIVLAKDHGFSVTRGTGTGVNTHLVLRFDTSGEYAWYTTHVRRAAIHVTTAPKPSSSKHDSETSGYLNPFKHTRKGC